MRIGALRQRVRIEMPVTARDSVTGDLIDTWATYADNVPCQIVPLSGREFIQSGANQAELTARAMVRWDAGIAPTMRLVHEGREYQITAVLPDPTFRGHATLMLGTGVNDGR